MNLSQNKPSGAIGIFDSGFGGLDIARGIREMLPKYDTLYLGDTARTPYGTRSKELIYEFTRQGVEFLFHRGATLVILACNTASSDALRKVQQEYLPKHFPDRSVLGVLIPAAETAVTLTKNNRIGVIATPATVHSGSFLREIRKAKCNISLPFARGGVSALNTKEDSERISETLTLFQQACPLLVPLVEAGEESSPLAEIILRKYLEPFVAKSGIDTLILGCTHYGLMEKTIRDIIGSDIAIVNEAKIVPDKLRDYLARHPEHEQCLSTNHSAHFFTTDIGQNFQKLAPRFFGEAIQVEKITLK